MMLWQDLKIAARQMTKNRGFTAAAVTALALGIGVNAMAFTVVNAILLRSVPINDPDRFVQISMLWRGGRYGNSLPDVEDWQRESQTFSSFTAVLGSGFSLVDEGQPAEQFRGTYSSANIFDAIGKQPMIGRSFTPDDDRRGAAPVLILSHGLWTRRYGADPAAIGRQVRVNGVAATVIGVMPEGLEFPFNNELWVPLSQLPPDTRDQKRDVRIFSVFARLADGVTLPQAQGELTAICARLEQQYQEFSREVKPSVVSYQESVSAGPLRLMVLSMMGAVAFVLLIACANVANLLLARAAHRSKEVAVRVSLGATRWRIIRQLLVESVLLAVLSGLVGAVLAVVGIRLFESALPAGRPYWVAFTPDPIVLAFLAAVSVGTGIVFGLAPALHVSKTGVSDVLKESGRSGTVGVRARRWTGALMVVEVSLTLALLAGAGFMMRSFLMLYRLDIGVDTRQLLMMQLPLPDAKYPTVEDRNRFLERVNVRLAGISAIESATTASSVPFGGAHVRYIAVNGRPAPEGQPLPLVSMVTVGPRYLQTIGVPLMRGRALLETDGLPGQEAVVINERLAAVHFPGEDPIGKMIRLSELAPSNPATGWATIVGVMPNVRQRFQFTGAQDRLPDAVVYLPVRGNPNADRGTSLLVRAQGDPTKIAALVREEMRLLDPDLPVFAVQTVDTLLANQRWPFRVFGMTFATFAAIALLLSAVGLYAVTAYSVTQRTHEIGVRMALGAQRADVWWMVARRALIQVTLGLVFGLAAAIGVGTLLRSTLVFTNAADPATLVTISAVMVIVALAAALRPAQRATQLDPVVALRYE